MTLATPESVSSALEAVFGNIQEKRMADVPVLNSALKVQAVGFRIWNEHFVGILITPWFMNLVLVPQDPGGSQQLTPGATNSHAFPSGDYEFLGGEEAGIGPYQSCSLYSPMFEFENQEAAVATAGCVMEYLMAEQEPDDDTVPEDDPQPEIMPAVTAADKVRTFNRRELLRGALRENGS